MLSLYHLKLMTHRIARSGVSMMAKHLKLRHLTILVGAVVFVGLCDLSIRAGMAKSTEIIQQKNLAELSKPQMYRYAMSVQMSVAQNPDKLLSLSLNDLKLMLASPDLYRQDGMGKVWQYRTESCVFDVFMTDSKVMHYEFRSRHIGDETEINQSACLRDLFDSRKNQIAKAFEDFYAVSLSAKISG